MNLFILLVIVYFVVLGFLYFGYGYYCARRGISRHTNTASFYELLILIWPISMVTLPFTGMFYVLSIVYDKIRALGTNLANRSSK